MFFANSVLQKDADQLVFKEVREKLGLQQCKVFAFGTAPMQLEIRKYFMSINIPLMDLYGMSESSGYHTMSLIEQDGGRIGSCGKPIKGVQQKILEQDENREGEVSWEKAI